MFDSKVDSALLSKLASPRFPIVVLDRYLAVDYLFPVLLDNQQGTREAFRHLYAQGARQLALCRVLPIPLTTWSACRPS